MVRSAKTGAMSPLQFREATPVAVNRINVCAGAEQLSQGKRKRAGTGPEVRPRSAGGQVRRAEKIYVVIVVHGEILPLSGKRSRVTISQFIRHVNELY